MRLCMFLSTVDASLGRSTFIIICLSARPFLGLVGDEDDTPVSLQPTSGVAGIFPLGCLFLQGAFQHFGYFLALASHPCPIWIFTWGLCSVLEGSPFPYQCLRGFWRGFRSCRQIYNCSHASWMISPIQFPREYPILLLGLVSTRSSVIGLYGLLVFIFPAFSEGLQNYRNICFALVSGVPGSLLPTFCYFLHLTKNVLTVCFPSL